MLGEEPSSMEVCDGPGADGITGAGCGLDRRDGSASGVFVLLPVVGASRLRGVSNGEAEGAREARGALGLPSVPAVW